jgi:hypothetical protein
VLPEDTAKGLVVPMKEGIPTKGNVFPKSSIWGSWDPSPWRISAQGHGVELYDVVGGTSEPIRWIAPSVPQCFSDFVGAEGIQIMTSHPLFQSQRAHESTEDSRFAYTFGLWSQLNVCIFSVYILASSF